MARFGRGFEVKIGQLEEAIACKRPQENTFLAMIHARLLSSRKELKAMRLGEDKFPYRWVDNGLCLARPAVVLFGRAHSGTSTPTILHDIRVQPYAGSSAYTSQFTHSSD